MGLLSYVLLKLIQVPKLKKSFYYFSYREFPEFPEYPEFLKCPKFPGSSRCPESLNEIFYLKLRQFFILISKKFILC